jgi:hypothetical protein
VATVAAASWVYGARVWLVAARALEFGVGGRGDRRHRSAAAEMEKQANGKFWKRSGEPVPSFNSARGDH